MSRKLAVLNESKKVEDLLSFGFTQNSINFSDLSLLAKHFFNLGYDKEKIKEELVKYCKKNYPSFNSVINETLIERAVKSGIRFNLKNPSGINIPVYKREIEKIKNLPINLYKFCFTILVLSRYNKFSSTRRIQVKRKLSGSYYANYNFMDIMRMAGLGKSPKKKEADIMKYELGGKRGLISAHEFDRNTWKVLFAEDGLNDEISVLVTDIESIKSFIPFFCVKCGNVFEKKSKREHCDNCYPLHRRETIRKAVEKTRKNK